MKTITVKLQNIAASTLMYGVDTFTNPPQNIVSKFQEDDVMKLKQKVITAFSVVVKMALMTAVTSAHHDDLKDNVQKKSSQRKYRDA